MNNQENKISHLQMIQNVIDRMGKNSFSLKEWSIGIIIAIYAFAGQTNRAVIITLMPLIVFWALDTYYLMLEKKYRKLYDEVRKKDNDKIDFDLNVGNCTLKMNEIKKFEYARILFSKSELLFYMVCIVTTVIVYFIKF